MDEKLSILKMVEDGKITADEAVKLMEAIDNKNEEISLIKIDESKKTKFVKIKVISVDGDRVNISLPVALIDIAFKLAGQNGINSESNINFNNLNINIDDIIKMIQEGAEGKIVDIESADGDIVQITVE